MINSRAPLTLLDVLLLNPAAASKETQRSSRGGQASQVILIIDVRGLIELIRCT